MSVSLPEPKATEPLIRPSDESMTLFEFPVTTLPVTVPRLTRLTRPVPAIAVAPALLISPPAWFWRTSEPDSAAPVPALAMVPLFVSVPIVALTTVAAVLFARIVPLLVHAPGEIV